MYNFHDSTDISEMLMLDLAPFFLQDIEAICQFVKCLPNFFVSLKNIGFKINLGNFFFKKGSQK